MVKKIVITLIITNLFFAINCMNRKFKQEKSKEHEKNVSAQKLQNILTQSYFGFNPRSQDIIIQYTGFKDDRLSDGAVPSASLRNIIDKSGIPSISGLPAGIIAQYVASQSWNKNEIFTKIPEAKLNESSNYSYGTIGTITETIKLSPNGQYFAVFINISDEIEIWDFNSNQLIKTLRFEQKEISSLAFSHDNKYLALGFNNDRMIKIYDIEKRKYDHSFDKTYVGKTCVVTDLQYSQDGRYLAFGTNSKISKLIKLKTKAQISFDEKCTTYAIAFSHDNKIMITCIDKGAVKVWDLNEKGCKCKFIYDSNNRGRGYEIHQIKFSPNDKYFASSSYNQILKLWDSETYSKLNIFNQAVCFDFSSDSQYIAIGFKDNSIKVFDLENKCCILTLVIEDSQEIDTDMWPQRRNNLRSIFYTPNGKFLIACCKFEIIKWEIREN